MFAKGQVVLVMSQQWRMRNEEDESLGGEIISPRNADRRQQALVDKISPLDIARLGNVRYHGTATTR